MVPECRVNPDAPELYFPRDMKHRRLFCELGPWAYELSRRRCIIKRKISDLFGAEQFAGTFSAGRLPVVIYRHSSLIRRRLGNVDMQLQENKAVNLAISAPKISGIIIRPGETFSFWRLVGADTRRNGYKEGLTIANGQPSRGTGGGLCQFTNLIHWMILHSQLTITEHHHHEGIDLFPDFNRQIPFGTGTSIVYNYLDYRFRNLTSNTYQLIVYTDGEYLRGELRAEKPQPMSFHIHAEDEYFSEEEGVVYRNGKVYRDTIDRATGLRLKTELLRVNHARVMYDTSGLHVIK